LPKPQSDLAQGLLTGQDRAMPERVKDDFAGSGLSHLTAVSGTNIMILVMLAERALAGLALPGRWSAAASTVLAWAYVAGIGAPASAVRAVLMASLAVLARLSGRLNALSGLMAAAWCAMLLVNPAHLYDIGFQLSFAALAGTAWLAPRLDACLARSCWRRQAALREALALVVAAQLATAPLVWLHFGRLSWVALPANLLVAWLAMPLTLVLMAALAASAAFPGLAGFLFGAADPLLAYMVQVAAWLGRY
jgi:competence protein ComEC